MKKPLLYLSAPVLMLAVASSASADLVLQYTFDEASGDAVDTGTGTPSNGVLTGGAVRSANTPSGTGSSVDFIDDPYAHVLSGDAAKLDGLSALTLTTWLDLDAYTSGNNRLMSKQNGNVNFDGFSWNMNATPNDGAVGPDNFRLGLFLGGSGGFAAPFSNADVDATEWTFLATTYDTATNTVAFYTGGVDTPVTLLGTPQTLSPNPGVIDGLEARFGVGFTEAASGANVSALGRQDDVRVYDEALGLAALEAVRLANIPEPTSMAALALAGAGLFARRRRA